MTSYAQPNQQGYTGNPAAPPYNGGGYAPGYAVTHAPGTVDYGYGAPHMVYAYGAPPGNAPMLQPGALPINSGYPVGNPAYAYAAPQPGGYVGGTPAYSASGAAPGYPVAGAPSYPGDAPNSVQGYPGGTPKSTPGYPVEAPGHQADVPNVQEYPIGTPSGYPVGVSPPGSTEYPHGAPVVIVSQAKTTAKNPVKVALEHSPIPPHQLEDPSNQICSASWATGLFSCMDDTLPNFLMTLLCPCVSLAQVYARLGLQEYISALVQFAFLYLVIVVSLFVGPGDIVVPIFLLVFGLHITYARYKARERFRISGSIIGDCATVFYCSCCALTQIATHVKSYTASSYGFGAPDVLPPYPS